MVHVAGDTGWVAWTNTTDAAIAAAVASDALKLPITTAAATYSTPAQVATLITASNLRGVYASRPSATAVPSGTVYSASDVPEQYRSNGSTWDVVGSGGNELGYAQIAAATAAIGTTTTDVPGLSVTFVAGERPVEVKTEGMFLANTTATYAYLTLVLTSSVVGQLLRRANVAGEYLSLTRSARISGLTAGTSYTVKVQVNVDAGTITPQGSATNPSYISVKTL